jgi:DnaJ family protein B protein 4
MASLPNYYEILNVHETATHEEIKKSYRKLSLKHHPDKNPNDKNSDLFKKINDAYETLGDKDKKKIYDNMRAANDTSVPLKGFNHFTEENIHEFFNDLFTTRTKPPFPSGNKGTDNGSEETKDNFGHFPLHHFHPIFAALNKPVAIINHVKLNMDQVYNGCCLPLEIERWFIENNVKIMEKETIYVSIPRGIDNNEVIVFKEKGNIIHENCKGDVKVIVSIDNNTSFVREGLNLIFRQTISLKEALCGFTFVIKHLNGKPYTIFNKAGNIVTPNSSQNIRNLGLVRENDVGDLVILFDVSFPKVLSEETVKEIEKICF